MLLHINIPDDIWDRAMYNQNAIDISIYRTDAINGYGAIGHAVATFMEFVEIEQPDEYKPASGRRSYRRFWRPSTGTSAKFEPLTSKTEQEISISLFDEYVAATMGMEGAR